MTYSIPESVIRKISQDDEWAIPHSKSSSITLIVNRNNTSHSDTFSFKIYFNNLSNLLLGLPRVLFPISLPVNMFKTLISFPVLAI